MSRHGLDETDPAAGGRRHFVKIKSSSDYARHIYALLPTTGMAAPACQSQSHTINYKWFSTCRSLFFFLLASFLGLCLFLITLYIYSSWVFNFIYLLLVSYTGVIYTWISLEISSAILNLLMSLFSHRRRRRRP
jgi:hypothetical protein